ncbi:hypothetical protein SteCoe_31296 [Stentor coeruleus]|uniref:Endonuclease/exonuclease/phosphatase domain-containing protein n=1 Tax=Stentor coeruleus TaxID=5963 RepID=A0A1R2B1L5_9CILI|nr:hypothetical protein SteCoe_31296 [Stentor coeruleus]
MGDSSYEEILCKPKPLSSFSVASYNILADAYSSYMTHCPGNFLSFEYRSSLIFDEIREMDADFVCLQEVDRYYDYMEPFFKNQGYESLWMKRPSYWNPDGSLIAWKKNVWELVEAMNLSFNEHPICQKNQDYARNGVGVVGMFRNKENQSGVIIGTAHFYWDPALENVKFLQSVMFKSAVYRMKEKYSVPVVITGDFNSLPDSPPIKYLTNQEFSLNLELYSHKEILVIEKPQEFTLFSSYANYSELRYPEYTNYTPDFKGCIDYILYSEGLRVINLRKVLDSNDLKQYKGLPSEKHPSDHLPLQVWFSGSD